MAFGMGRREAASSLGGVIWTCVTLLLVQVVCADKTAADYFVKSLPGAPEGPLLKMHAGHVEVSHEHNGNLFFWHYENRHIANRKRTVIWLNGGPGCSSEDGALMEIGPYRLASDSKLKYQDGSWDEFANLLFVDNPVGTGYSYVDTDSFLHELQEMADQFMLFLEKWFKIFPEYADDDIYIAGESYAGMHIPYIARTLLDRNLKVQTADRWNLKGILIGNGWMSPFHQYNSYSTFAYAEGLIQGGTPSGDTIDKSLSACLKDLAKPGAENHVSINRCERVLNDILDVSRKDGQCVNMYDVRLTDSFPSCGMNWPPDLVNVTPYLRRDDVVAALHVNSDKRTGWSECSGSVSAAFRATNSVPTYQLLPGLLERGLPILLFSGAKDLICNHLGTEDMIADMKWSGGTGFETSPGVYAPKRDWIFEGEAAGIYQEARNLTYVLFYNSSHMVPFDYPRRSRDMLDRFMGVDIASIGGKPVDSQIDGEKAHSETSVGGHPNSTVAQNESKEQLEQAKNEAYRRSGEAFFMLMVVVAAAVGFGFCWTRRRRQRATQENELGMYTAVPAMHHKTGDVEAQDFDENELQNLGSGHRRFRDGDGDGNDDHMRDHYDIGSDSDSEDDGVGGKPKSEKP